MGTKAGMWSGGRARAPSETALLVCGVIVGPLLMIVATIEGATRPDYDPLRDSISALALGSDLGWIQSLNFIVAGLLTLAFAVGVRRVLRPQKGWFWGSMLIGLWGVGLLGAGIFATDPDPGYPPGALAALQGSTMHGILHDWSAGIGFPALLAACIVFARSFAAQGERGWALYSALSGAGFIIFTLLHNYTSAPDHRSGAEISGLFQRIAVTIGWAWLTALAVYLLLRRPPHPAPTPDASTSIS